MKFKKILTKIICLLMVIPMMLSFTACRSDGLKDDLEFDEFGDPIFKDVKLKVWSVIGAPDNAYLDKVNRMFNDYYRDNGIEAEITSIDTSLYYTQLANTINTNPSEAPDVVIFHSERLTYLVDNKLLVPMDEYFTAGKTDFKRGDYLDNIISECIVDDKTYGVPLDIHAGVWFVRTDILEKNGLSKPTNLQEFEAVCESLMQKKAAGTLYIRSMDKNNAARNEWRIAPVDSDFFPVEMSDSGGIENGWIPQTAVLQNGGKIVNSDGEPAWAEGTALKTTLEMFKNDWQGKFIGENRDYNTLWANLANGNAVFGCEGPWWTEQRLKEYESILGDLTDISGKKYQPLGIMGLSNLYAENSSGADANKVYGVGHCFSITKTVMSKTKRVAASIYSKFMTENAADYMAGGHLPASKKVLASDEYLQSEAYTKYLKDMGDPSNYVTLGNTPYYEEVYEYLKQTYVYTFNKNRKDKTVQQNIDDCFTKAMQSIEDKKDL